MNTSNAGHLDPPGIEFASHNVKGGADEGEKLWRRTASNSWLDMRRLHTLWEDVQMLVHLIHLICLACMTSSSNLLLADQDL